MVGDAVTARAMKLLPALPGGLVWPVLAAIFLVSGVWLFWSACGLSLRDFSLAFGIGSEDQALAFRLEDRLHETAARVAAQNRSTSWVKYFSPRNRALVLQSPANSG